MTDATEALADLRNIDAQTAEIERLTASEKSAWNAAVTRDEEIERLRADAHRDTERKCDDLRAALIAAMEIIHSWRAINAQQDRQVPEIYEFGKKLDAVIAQADAALGSEA